MLNDCIDQTCMDSVIGMHWIKEGVFCLHTEDKEIIIELDGDPVTKQL